MRRTKSAVNMTTLYVLMMFCLFVSLKEPRLNEQTIKLLRDQIKSKQHYSLDILIIDQVEDITRTSDDNKQNQGGYQYLQPFSQIYFHSHFREHDFLKQMNHQLQIEKQPKIRNLVDHNNNETNQSSEILGCELIMETFPPQCAQCNLNSQLRDNKCYCNFNYQLKYTQAADGTYTITVYSFLRFVDTITPYTSLTCTGLFTLQESPTIKSNTSNYLLMDVCSVNVYEQMGRDPKAYSNYINITNVPTQEFKDFFSGQISYKLRNEIILRECTGEIDYLIAYKESESNTTGQIIGCIEYSSDSKCSQCNEYSNLNKTSNYCQCEFRYNITYNQTIQDSSIQNGTTTQKSDVKIKHFLNISDNLLNESLTDKIDCKDILEFIFITEEAKNNLEGDLEYIHCKLDYRAYDLNLDPNDTTVKYPQQIELQNCTQDFFYYFVYNTVILRVNESLINSECTNPVDHKIAYSGSECGQTYCIGSFSNVTNPPPLFSPGSGFLEPSNQACLLFDINSDCMQCKAGYILVQLNHSYVCIRNPCSGSQYYDFSTNKCYTCPFGCEQCNENGTCYSCNQTTFLFQDGNQTSCLPCCPAGIFTDFQFRRCTLCDPACSECQQNPNFKCENGQYGVCINNSIECHPVCPDNYWPSNDNCHKCGQNCNQCTANDNCIECAPGNILILGLCSPLICTSNHQYVINNQSCQECDIGCLTCSLKSNNCTSCPNNTILANGSCIPQSGMIPQCQSGQSFDANSNECVLCSQNCLNCSSPLVCTKCVDGFFTKFNSATNSTPCWQGNCPNSYYTDKKNKTCIPCSQGCSECTLSGDCQICKSGWYLGKQGCIKECPLGQYLGQDFLKYYECKDCPAHCANCSSALTCEQCESGYIRIQSQFNDVSDYTLQKAVGSYCVPTPQQCPNGTYYSQDYNACISCPIGCAQCNSSGQCIKNCSSSCIECVDQSLNCIQCPFGQVLIQQGTHYICQQPCNTTVGQYYDTVNNTCSQCSSNCNKCINQTYCQICENGTYLMNINGSFQCVNDCNTQQGYFLDNSSQRCIQCDPNCVSCDTTGRCNLCNSYTSLSQYSGKCYCQFKYQVTILSYSYAAQFDFYNITWNPYYQYLFNGAKSPCTRIFDFNFTFEGPSDLSAIQCLAYQLQNSIRIVMHNCTDALQMYIMQESLKLYLKTSVYTMNCILQDNSQQALLFPDSQYFNYTLSQTPWAETRFLTMTEFSQQTFIPNKQEGYKSILKVLVILLMIIIILMLIGVFINVKLQQLRRKGKIPNTTDSTDIKQNGEFGQSSQDEIDFISK